MVSRYMICRDVVRRHMVRRHVVCRPMYMCMFFGGGWDHPVGSTVVGRGAPWSPGWRRECKHDLAQSRKKGGRGGWEGLNERALDQHGSGTLMAAGVLVPYRSSVLIRVFWDTLPLPLSWGCCSVPSANVSSYIASRFSVPMSVPQPPYPPRHHMTHKLGELYSIYRCRIDSV